jgi:hypothetical protein
MGLIVWQLSGKDFIFRADIPRRITVAIQTPVHVQRRCSPHQRHCIYFTMALDARYPFGNVDTVIEVDKIWKIVDSSPMYGSIISEALADRLEHRAVNKNL